jgi:radical SAM superfamily enzyme YgiQ (UPF0313 family)
MKVLYASVATPVYDKTLHYFQAVFSANAGYLRQRLPHDEVRVEAAGLNGAPHRVILRHLAEAAPPAVLVLWSRVWEAPATLRMARLARQIHPSLKIWVWGDAAFFMPQYFEREPFDGLVVGGDAELVLADALDRQRHGLPPQHGMRVRTAAGWLDTAPGRQLDPREWPYPLLEAVDPQAYHNARVHRGKAMDDLSFTVSRGCPIRCAPWCPTPWKEGITDRRRPARATVEYMLRGPAPYDMFQMHSPLFAQDRAWVREFVDLKGILRPETPFKVVDVATPYADEGLVADLASVGLYGVGFGVETLSAAHKRVTPKVDESLLRTVARNFARHGVVGKAYTQIGLPGQQRADILYTHHFLRDLGFEVRATGSTPFWKLRRMSVAELDDTDLVCWDRKSFYDPSCGLSPREFHQIITAPTAFVEDEVLQCVA